MDLSFEAYLEKKLRERAEAMETETIFDRDFRACVSALLASQGSRSVELNSKLVLAAHDLAVDMQSIREANCAK